MGLSISNFSISDIDEFVRGPFIERLGKKAIVRNPAACGSATDQEATAEPNGQDQGGESRLARRT